MSMSIFPTKWRANEQLGGGEHQLDENMSEEYWILYICIYSVDQPTAYCPISASKNNASNVNAFSHYVLKGALGGTLTSKRI